MKTTVLCLFGGKSSEYEVSLVSAYSILTNINKDMYNIVTVGITKDGDWFRYDGDTENIKDGSWCKDTSVLNKAFLSPSPSDSALFVLSDGVITEKIHISK